MEKKLIFKKYLLPVLLLGSIGSGCKDYLQIPLPSESMTDKAVFVSDGLTGAALTTIIYRSNDAGNTSLGYNLGLYTDELQPIFTTTGAETNLFLWNQGPDNPYLDWFKFYNVIYNTNVALENIPLYQVANKNQWLGEAYFCRALTYLRIVSVFGDAVLTTSSDFNINRTLPRVKKEKIYEQAINDLNLAVDLLSNEYRDNVGKVTTKRGRPNKQSALALLARAYLYAGQNEKAAATAALVIADTRYRLLQGADIKDVFLAGSPEMIFGTSDYDTGSDELDWAIYNGGMPNPLPAYPSTSTNGVIVALSPSLLNAFEKNSSTGADDLRKTNWTRSALRPGGPPDVAATTVTWYFPDKCKTREIAKSFSPVLRLAEQYLIRAEAYARLNQLDKATDDLNVVRNRAGLTATTATTQTQLLDAVLQERRVELFSEQGHRFFDLRRLGKLDETMRADAVNRYPAVWLPRNQYFPINITDIKTNPNLLQTEGY